MQLSSIIFDMDGVLIDSEPAHKLAKERAFIPASFTKQELARSGADFVVDNFEQLRALVEYISRQAFVISARPLTQFLP
jgi:phosphoglycolate phosphatase-like HAD superfamily hydrolase